MRVLFLLLFIACTANSQICVKWRLESLDKSGFSICVHSDNPIDNPTDNVTNARLRMTKAATWSADEEEEFSVSASRDGVCLLTTVLDPSQAYLVDLGLYDGVWSDYTDCQTELATFDCNSFSGCDNAVDADGVVLGLI